MKLDQIRALISAATPGPWWAESAHVEVESCNSASLHEAGQPTTVTQSMVDVEASHLTVANCFSGLADRDLPECEANAAFIAASRTLMPKLLKVAQASQDICSIHRLDRNFATCPCALCEALAALESDE